MAPLDETSLNKDASVLSIEEIGTRIRELEGLPPFPATATQILTLCEQPDLQVKSIIQLIECEPAIGARVLQLANSPLYGMTRPIATIAHAVVVLGIKTVAQLAVAIATGELFQKGDPSLAAIRKATYLQSLACATVTRSLASITKRANPDEAFLSGVMHDIGKLVFFDIVPTPYCDIIQADPTGRTSKKEIESFGVDHPTVGKNCGDKWGLPAEINLAILNHHCEFDATEHPLSQIVISANYFARKWNIGYEQEKEVVECWEIENAFETVPLSELQAEVNEQFAAVIEICEI